jgi:hypothetical protein
LGYYQKKVCRYEFPDEENRKSSRNFGSFAVRPSDAAADPRKLYLNQNTGRNHSIKTDNISFESVEEFKYLGTTLTDQNSIQEEVNE